MTRDQITDTQLGDDDAYEREPPSAGTGMNQTHSSDSTLPNSPASMQRATGRSHVPIAHTARPRRPTATFFRGNLTRRRVSRASHAHVRTPTLARTFPTVQQPENVARVLTQPPHAHHSTSPPSRQVPASFDTNALHAFVNAFRSSERPRKYTLKEYSGADHENLESWANRARAVASQAKWSPTRLYGEAHLALKGDAFDEWHNHKDILNSSKSFDALLDVLRARFVSANEAAEALEALMSFTQQSSETAAAYISRFRTALARAQRAGFTDENTALHIFTRGVHFDFGRA